MEIMETVDYGETDLRSIIEGENSVDSETKNLSEHMDSQAGI